MLTYFELGSFWTWVIYHSRCWRS